MSGQQLHPWNRQPGESEESFEAFNIYRLLGVDRSLEKVAEQLKKHPKTIRRHSASNKWVARAAAWDNEIAKKSDDLIISEAQKMDLEHLQVWRAVRAAGATAAQRLLRDMKKTDRNLLSPRDTIAMLEKATNYERLISDKATARVEQKFSIDVDALDPAEAEKLLELLKKAGYEG